MLVEACHLRTLESSPRLKLVKEEDPRPGKPLRISEGPQDKVVRRHLCRLEEVTGPHRLDVQAVRRHISRAPPRQVIILRLKGPHRRLFT